LRFKLPTTGCGFPPDCEKSYRKIAVAFTSQAGTAFSGSGGAGKPAPLSFHQWTTLASARMLQALQKPATSTLSP